MDLEAGTLESLKAVVGKNCPEGLTADGVTVKGFLALNKLFIQRGRHETTWTILRVFGYDDDLELRRDFLRPSLKVPAGSSVELSHEGYEFLSAVFRKYDRDADGCLSPKELIDFFSTCPVMPWGPDVYNSVPTSPNNGWITYKGFSSMWTLTTLLDAHATLEHLAYLGYTYYSGDGDQTSALQVTRDKRVDLAKKQTSRNVYRCHVIGPRDAGKTTFCQGILGRSRQDVAHIRSSDFPKNTINTVSVYGQEKYLTLEDIDLRNVHDALMPSEVLCDVACLVYDVANPRSFEFVARIFLVRANFCGKSHVPLCFCRNITPTLASPSCSWATSVS